MKSRNATPPCPVFQASLWVWRPFVKYFTSVLATKLQRTVSANLWRPNKTAYASVSGNQQPVYLSDARSTWCTVHAPCRLINRSWLDLVASRAPSGGSPRGDTTKGRPACLDSLPVPRTMWRRERRSKQAMGSGRQLCPHSGKGGMAASGRQPRFTKACRPCKVAR